MQKKCPSCMSSNMITQPLLCGKWLTTVITSIWFISCMSSNMLTQTLLCGKWLITVITSIWFFSCMSSNMITQHLLCAKRLTTVVTSICFLTCISSNMLTQTLLCGKWLITVVTVGRSPSVSLPESLLHMYLTQESWHAGLRPLWSWLLIPYSITYSNWWPLDRK